MFATADLIAKRPEMAVAVTASAILHLHDREYVFLPGAANGSFRRVQVKTGRNLDGNNAEILSGIPAGQQVVSNALDLQNTADQE